MEDQSVKKIVDELRQLIGQYAQEVPSRRGSAWPKSIKERVFQLLELKVSTEIISSGIGIPAATIYSWKSKRPKNPEFLPATVVANREEKSVAALPKAPKSSQEKKSRRTYREKIPTIIVIAPNGVRFEGLDIAAALQIASRLGFEA